MAARAILILVELHVFAAVKCRCGGVAVALRNAVFVSRWTVGDGFKTFARNGIRLTVAPCTVLVVIVYVKFVP